MQNTSCMLMLNGEHKSAFRDNFWLGSISSLTDSIVNTCQTWFKDSNVYNNTPASLHVYVNDRLQKFSTYDDFYKFVTKLKTEQDNQLDKSTQINSNIDIYDSDRTLEFLVTYDSHNRVTVADIATALARYNINTDHFGKIIHYIIRLNDFEYTYDNIREFIYDIIRLYILADDEIAKL